MAIFLPFRAIRPQKELTEKVVTRSYEAYSFRERQRIQSKNPFSFLNILNPSFENGRRLRGKRRYKRVNQEFECFLRDGVLARDTTACYYLYRNTEEEISVSGVLGAMAISEYTNNAVKKHEDTIKRREERFADFLEGAKFNAEPVLIAYPNHPNLDDLILEKSKEKPEVTFKDDRGILHELWPIQNPDTIEHFRKCFSEISNTYIMDGHHRSASSVLYASRQAPNHCRDGKPFEFFMSCLIPESQLHIESFCRLITDLAGQSRNEILSKIAVNFWIEEKDEELWEPKNKHEFSMFLDGKFYNLRLKEVMYPKTDPVNLLDSKILTETILKPIFEIEDPRHDSRLQYLWGKHPARELQQAVQSGCFAVGFAMMPISMIEIKNVADAGHTMPPKSTFIKPKLPSGLTVYEL